MSKSAYSIVGITKFDLCIQCAYFFYFSKRHLNSAALTIHASLALSIILSFVVVMAGLEEADRGAQAAEEAMQGARALQKMRLEKRLAFLGTLGNNAPFIGLLGTVIGVVMAFDQLGQEAAGAAHVILAFRV